MSGNDVDMNIDAESEQSEDEQYLDVDELQALQEAGEVQIVNDTDEPIPNDDDDDDTEAGNPDEAMDGEEGPAEMAHAVLQSHTKGVHAVDIHPTLPLVASGGEDDKAFLWQVELGNKTEAAEVKQPRNDLEGHSDTVVSVAFSADGTYLATGGMDGRVILWKAADGSHVATMEDLGEAISYLLWHPKGNILFAGSADSQSAMWNEKGVCLQFFTGHAAAVTCGALVNDSKMLASGSEDFSVKIFAPKSGELVAHFENRGKGMHMLPPEAVTALSPHPRVSDTLIAGYEGGSIAFLSIAAKKVLNTLAAHPSAVECIAVSPLVPYVVTCCAGENGLLLVWNAESSNVTIRDQIKQEAGFVSCKWQGEHLYAIDTQGNVTRFEGLSVSTAPSKVFTGHLDTALSLAVHPDGWIVSGSDDTTVRVFHPAA